MTVGELIKELQKYDENQRVMLYSHGRCSVKEQDEILGCYEEKIYDENDDVAEKVVSLYEYQDKSRKGSDGMSWGISENASEKEKLKAEVNDYFHGLNAVGQIDYICYSELYDACMPILEECYDRMEEERKG